MIPELLPFIQEQVQAILGSEVSHGMFVLAVLGAIGYQCRALPGYIWNLFKSQFVLTMTVYADDNFYRYITVWMGKKMNPRRSRNLSVTSEWDESTEQQKFSLIPGPGHHIIFNNKRPFLIHRNIEKQGDKDNSWLVKRNETITIQTLGRDQSVLRGLMDEALSVIEDQNTVSVFFWSSGHYELAGRRAKRELDTIYMDETQKQEIVRDLQKFLTRRKWYAARGIPWRRGYMLEGPPGTGKTSLIFALASLLNKPIYIINPATLLDDNSLQDAINSAGAGIVVIEDIDSITILEERAATKTTAAAKKGEKKEKAERGLTLSGFLNAIDGIAAQEGRILFITSNHADKLDAALKRPGRVDRSYFLDHIKAKDINIALRMFDRFFPEGDREAFRKEIAPQLPMSTAAIQGILIKKEQDTDVAEAA